jgi:pSer/pThr/pTyr-binding forkhead associated (FHA) protein
LIVGDDGSEFIVEVAECTLQIGRSPANDIVLADPTQGVSRTHAELRFRNGRCVIIDLDSRNGTITQSTITKSPNHQIKSLNRQFPQSLNGEHHGMTTVCGTVEGPEPHGLVA